MFSSRCAIAYILVSFVLFAYQRSSTTVTTPTTTAIATTPVTAAPQPEPLAVNHVVSHSITSKTPVIATVVKEKPHTLPHPAQAASRKRKPIEKLRQQCKDAGIQWRNTHGKGKHLTTREMQQALGHV